MPKIPNYSDDAPVPLHVPLAEGSNFRLAPVKPDSTVDFGAQASGKAFEAIGGLANQLAIKAQAQANQKDVTDRLTGYNRDMGNLSNELMSRQGEMVEAADATDTTPARDSIVGEYAKRSAEIYNNWFGGNAAVQQKFRESALTTENAYANQITKHYNDQHAAAQVESDDAYLSSVGDQFSSAIQMGDFQLADNLAANMERLQGEKGIIRGTTAEKMKLDTQTWYGNQVTTAVMGKLSTDPDGAESILDHYKDKISTATFNTLSNQLMPAVENGNIEKFLQSLIDTGKFNNDDGTLNVPLLRQYADAGIDAGRFDRKGAGNPLARASSTAADDINAQVQGADIKPEWIYGVGGHENQNGDSARAWNTETQQWEESNNFFNIKYGGEGKFIPGRTQENVNGELQWEDTQWQAYDTPEDGGHGFSAWILRNLSPDEIRNIHSEADLVNAMKAHGYFTDDNVSGYISDAESWSADYTKATSATTRDPNLKDRAYKIIDKLAQRANVTAMQIQKEHTNYILTNIDNGTFTDEDSMDDHLRAMHYTEREIANANNLLYQRQGRARQRSNWEQQDLDRASKEESNRILYEMTFNGYVPAEQDIKGDGTLQPDDAVRIWKTAQINSNNQLKWMNSLRSDYIKQSVHTYAQAHASAENDDGTTMFDKAKETEMALTIVNRINLKAEELGRAPTDSEIRQIVGDELAKDTYIGGVNILGHNFGGKKQYAPAAYPARSYDDGK